MLTSYPALPSRASDPKDMLDLDLDLEADLGIDTVKQAEMFASIRAAYNIPRDENLKLRDFPTLALVIKFARDRSQVGVPEPQQNDEPRGTCLESPLGALTSVIADCSNLGPKR